MGVRKNYRNLTNVERDRFVQALYHVKSTGLVDQFAEMHARHFFHGIHRSSHFLPWHREMVLRFERALQKYHADVTIPYWDSTVDHSPLDPLWKNDFLGQFNSGRRSWDLRRALGSATLPSPQQVQTNQGRGTYDAFWPELEDPIHGSPHRWVGGVMDGTASPGDPIFYLHHCWIDLLWVQWQLAHPGAPFVLSRPGAGLNDPLMEWPDRTPADVLDHRALGYTYDIEEPPRQLGAPIALAKQTDDILTAGFIDREGFFSVAHVAGTRAWNPPFRVGGPVGLPGGGVALARQTDNVFTAGFIDREGFFSVAHVAGTGAWNPPFRVGGPVGLPGGGVALARQTDNVFTAALLNQDGVFSVAHVAGTGAWNPPVPI